MRVSAAPERRVEVACTVHNTGPHDWRAAAGYTFSYQIFDPATGTLVEDGKRTPFEGDIAPGGASAVRVSVALPQQAGRYRIYLSPLQEDQAWFYEKGSPFLLLDVAVEDGHARVARQRVATLGRVRWETLARSAGRALWYPLRTIVRHRSLIRSMVRRDVSGRYRGSYGGLFWTVIHPLLMMVTYYFVFGLVLRARFGGDDRPSSFVLYFLTGMLPWLALSEAVGRSPTVVVEYRTFVKKLVFPIEILPVNLALAGLASEAFAAVILGGSLWFFDRPITATALYLPVLILPQFLLTLGLSWFLAALGVFFRDTGQIAGFALTLWFFITPICYPEASLPANWRWLFEQNPLYVLVENYRRILLEGAAPAWGALARLTVWSAVVVVAGHGWFYKLRRSFADLL